MTFNPGRAFWLAVLALPLLAIACGSKTDATVTADDPPAGATELAKSVVRVVRLKGDNPWKSCSGTIISPDGLVLTNAHCVDDRKKEYDKLAIGLFERVDAQPKLTLLAEIAAVDYFLDLSVVRVVSDLEGKKVPLNLPATPVGNSDAVQIGDYLRIYGYPGVGGDTITLTDGSVSGFLEDDFGPRSWIKTTVTIGHGSSGGTGVNRAQELIGVPTWTTSEECVPVQDTNGDGKIDKDDDCADLGARLSGLRPVAYAQPLIEAAKKGEPYVKGPPVAETPDPSKARFTNLVFSDGATADGRPIEVKKALPTGTKKICFFWDYEGMSNEFTWAIYWYIDGNPYAPASSLNRVWSAGESGHWWMCSNDAFPDGVHELILGVEKTPLLGDSVIVGGDHPPIVVTLQNTSNKTICAVYLKPAGGALLGQNELAPGVTVGQGQSANITVPAGAYTLRLNDCDANKIVEKEGMDLTRDTTLTVR